MERCGEPLAVLSGTVVDIEDGRLIGFIRRSMPRRVIVKHDEAVLELTTEHIGLAEGDQVTILIMPVVSKQSNIPSFDNQPPDNGRSQG